MYSTVLIYSIYCTVYSFSYVHSVSPCARALLVAGPRARGARGDRRGRGSGQRRSRASGGVLPRLDGLDRPRGVRLRPALRLRHLQAAHPGRLAARGAGRLAALRQPVGDRASRVHDTRQLLRTRRDHRDGPQALDRHGRTLLSHFRFPFLCCVFVCSFRRRLRVYSNYSCVVFLALPAFAFASASASASASPCARASGLLYGMLRSALLTASSAIRLCSVSLCVAIVAFHSSGALAAPPQRAHSSHSASRSARRQSILVSPLSLLFSLLLYSIIEISSAYHALYYILVQSLYMYSELNVTHSEQSRHGTARQLQFRVHPLV